MSTTTSPQDRLTNLRKYFGRSDLTLEDLSILTGVSADKLLSNIPERITSDYVQGFMHAELFPLYFRLDVVHRWKHNTEYWIGVASFAARD